MNCIRWHRTGECKPTGPREPSRDENCYTEIQEEWSGYCECTNGRQAMQTQCQDLFPLGCYCRHKYKTCNHACSAINGNYSMCCLFNVIV